MAVVDGMFLINTNPLQQTNNISSYADLLFNRFIRHYYQKGGTHVHLVFDNPGKHLFNPKELEQKRRDDKQEKGTTESKSHQHINFTPDTPIKRPWREYINCCQCKRSIVQAIGLAYLQKARSKLYQGQKFFLGGCIAGDDNTTTAWVILADHLIPQPESLYTLNSPEADMLIWCHALHSDAARVLIALVWP